MARAKVKSEPIDDTDVFKDDTDVFKGDTDVFTRKVKDIEIIRDDSTKPARIRIKGFDDSKEEVVRMTVGEMQKYIIEKASTYLRDPKRNPYITLKNRIDTANDKLKSQNEEFAKLRKMFENLYRDQVRFLRHTGKMPKAETNTVGVSVNLPWLPDSISTAINEDMLKKTGKSRVFLNPSEATVKVPRVKKSKEPIECIDLTSDGDDEPGVSNSTSAKTESKAKTTATSSAYACSIPTSTIPLQTFVLTPIAKPLQHPAPLPGVPGGRHESEVPPKPRLKISVDKIGIVLQWDMPPEARHLRIMGFEIFGYQEKHHLPISSALWKKIGSVEPMPLPMSCTLTQFLEGYKYHFSIRAFCKDDNFGHFSDPASIIFMPEIIT